MKPALGTFNDHPGLAALPALVRQQRRLESKLVPLEALAAEEKAVRAEIDVLLLAAGFKANNTGVTCAGYDVLHNHRDGRTSVNADKLLGAGVSSLDILLATDKGAPSNYAIVRPMKGAKVRAPRAA